MEEGNFRIPSVTTTEMNPSIPAEFFSSGHFSKSDWEVTLEEDSSTFQYPVVPPGAYSRLKILPLQVLLIQQLLEHPDLVADVELLPEVHDFLAHHIHETGQLSEANVAYWSRNASEIDFSFSKTFHSTSWLPKLSNCHQLSSLHLIHVPMIINDLICLSQHQNLNELSIGPLFSSHDVDSAAQSALFGQLSVFRIFLPDSPSSADLLVSFLHLLSAEHLVHLEIAVLGSIEVPWERICLKFENLEILRIDSLTLGSDTEITAIKSHIKQLKHISKLHIHYNGTKTQDLLFSYFRSYQAPSLTHISLLGASARTSPHSSKSDFQNLVLLPSEAVWPEFGVKLFPLLPNCLYFPNIPSRPLSSLIDTWMRYLKYASNHLDILAEIFGKLKNMRSAALLEALFDHPQFPALLVHCARVNAENIAFWPIFAPVMEHFFWGVFKLASPEATLTDTLQLATKRDIAFRKMIFEGVAPILERAVAVMDDASKFQSTLASSSELEDVLVDVELDYEVGSNRYRFRCVLELLRVIRLFARHAASDVYPARLCLSKSSVIVKYLSSDWYRLYSDLEAFRVNFLKVVYSGLESNQPMCDALESFDFSSSVDQMLLNWFPMCWEIVRHPNVVAGVLAPIPAILANVSPKYVKMWIQGTELEGQLSQRKENKVEFCRRMIRLIPHDYSVEWLPVLSMIVTYHGSMAQESPHEVICEELPSAVMRAVTLGEGAITGHLMVFAGSFCRFCRERFVVSSDGGINAVKFMAAQSSRNLSNFAKPIASWVLEPRERFSQWLLALKQQILAFESILEVRPEDRAQLKRATAVDFFNYLCQLFWSSICSIRSRIPIYKELTDWAAATECETLAIFSQMPLFCDFAWHASPATSLEWAEELLVKYGQPSQILSLLYHMTCYRGEEVCQAWISKTSKISRNNDMGGRKIAFNAEIPGRLIRPLKYDEKTQEEDILSVATETFLAGIFEFPRGSLFITLRVLANFSYYSPELRKSLQQSQYVPKLLSHALSLSESEGDVLGTLLLICEIFGDATFNMNHIGFKNHDACDIQNDSQIQRNDSQKKLEDQNHPDRPQNFCASSLPPPILKVLGFKQMRHYLNIAKESSQPWWDCCAIFLIRAIFARAIPSILISQSPNRHNTDENHIQHDNTDFNLTETEINDIQFLVDEIFRLSQRQDITTQEIAFQTISEAITVPEHLEGNALKMRNAVAHAVVTMIEAQYESSLQQQSKIEHFGYDSKAIAAFQKYQSLKLKK